MARKPCGSENSNMHLVGGSVQFTWSLDVVESSVFCCVSRPLCFRFCLRIAVQFARVLCAVRLGVIWDNREFEHTYGHRLARFDGQGNAQANTIWQEVWNLNFPRKIKHFAWKALNGSLPCYGILANRHIPLTPQCPFCSVGLEDIQHCLFTCNRAQEVWTEPGVQNVIEDAIM